MLKSVLNTLAVTTTELPQFFHPGLPWWPPAQGSMCPWRSFPASLTWSTHECPCVCVRYGLLTPGVWNSSLGWRVEGRGEGGFLAEGWQELTCLLSKQKSHWDGTHLTGVCVCVFGVSAVCCIIIPKRKQLQIWLWWRTQLIRIRTETKGQKEHL